MMQIEHNYLRTWIETFTRTVGPTTRTGKRGTLPEPAPDNANSVWLTADSLYGSDANPGTQASPKLTFNGATGALGGARTTVHIFRPVGSTIDIVFPETINTAFTGNYNLQVEDGETATLQDKSLTMNGTTKINGIYFDSYGLAFGNASTNSFVENCKLEFPVTDNYGPIITTSTGSAGNKVTIQYNELLNCAFNPYYGINFDALNNIFINIRTAPLSVTGNFNGSAIMPYRTGTTSTTQTYNIKRNIFVGFSPYYIDNGLPWSGTGGHVNGVPIYIDADQSNTAVTTMNLYSNYFFNNLEAIIGVGRAFDPYLTLNSDYNNFSGATILIYDTGQDASDVNLVVTDTNQIDGDTPALLHDETTAIQTADIESFRLQRTGQTTPDGTGKFFINSPLIEAGLSSVDLNPFDESIALNTEGFNKLLSIDWPPSQFDWNILHSNPANLRDVNGNLSRTFDAKRRRFIFSFGDGTHISNMQLKQIGLMLSDNGTKKLYPMGENANLFEEGISSTGIFLDTDNSLAPTVAGSVPMVNNWWQGFWINIAGDEFYIGSNDETKLYLIDKLGLGFPSNGLETFIIDSILVNAEAAPYSIRQSNFTSFRDGGFLREDPDGTIRPFDYTIDSITLEEIEDLIENI